MLSVIVTNNTKFKNRLSKALMVNTYKFTTIQSLIDFKENIQTTIIVTDNIDKILECKNKASNLLFRHDIEFYFVIDTTICDWKLIHKVDTFYNDGLYRALYISTGVLSTERIDTIFKFCKRGKQWDYYKKLGYKKC